MYASFEVLNHTGVCVVCIHNTADKQYFGVTELLLILVLGVEF